MICACAVIQIKTDCVQIVPFKDHQGICLIANGLCVHVKGFNVEYDGRLSVRQSILHDRPL